MQPRTNRCLLASFVAAAVLMAGAPAQAFGQRRVILNEAGAAPSASAPLEGGAVGSIGIRRVVFSPDGKRLLACGAGTSLWDVDAAKRVWSLPESRFVGQEPDVPGDRPMFSPDGKQVAWLSEPGLGDFMARGLPAQEQGIRFELHDAADGRLRRKFRHAHETDLAAVFVPSPDGRLLASTGHDENDAVRLWEMGTGKLSATLQHGRYPMALAWSPDGKLLALMSSAAHWQKLPHGVMVSGTGHGWSDTDVTVRVWDVKNGSQRGTFKAGGIPSWIAFSPDSKLLAATFEMHGLVICDLESVRLKQTLRHFPADMAAFTARGKTLVSCQFFSGSEKPSRIAGRPFEIGRVDLKTGKSQVVCQRRWADGEAGEPLACVAVSADGETVAVPDRGGKVLLLDTLTAKTRRVLQGLPNQLPACVDLSSDGTRVAEGTQQGSVIVWLLADAAPPQPSAAETQAPSPLRTWTSADGRFTIEAQLLKVDGDAVVLKKRSGSEVKVPLDKLSRGGPPVRQAAHSAQARCPGATWPMKLQVKIGQLLAHSGTGRCRPERRPAKTQAELPRIQLSASLPR